jgi:hypothetical protein
MEHALTKQQYSAAARAAQITPTSFLAVLETYTMGRIERLGSARGNC